MTLLERCRALEAGWARLAEMQAAGRAVEDDILGVGPATVILHRDIRLSLEQLDGRASAALLAAVDQLGEGIRQYYRAAP